MAASTSKVHHLNLIDAGIKKFKFKTNWEACIFCQRVDSEKVICPSNRNIRTISNTCGYKTISKNILILKNFNALPMSLNVARLHEELWSMEETFIIYKAKWHQKCGLQFNTKEVQRVIARNQITESSTVLSETNGQEPAIERCTRNSDATSSTVCLFCDEELFRGESLHLIRSHSMLNKIKICACKAKNSKLLALLSQGEDLIARNKRYHLKCLTSFLNASRPFMKQASNDLEGVLEGIAYSDLLTYIEETRYYFK